MIIYGIPNCNTVKKAQVWLGANGFSPEFHDFKKKGITAEKLNAWCGIFGWEKVLNKNGSTWKKLSRPEQEDVTDQERAVALMLANTSAIKRPILEVEETAVLIGFDETAYRQLMQ